MKGHRAAWLWFAGALGLYGLTAARGPMWADSSKLVLYATSGYLPSLNPGDHPGWTLVARCWLALTGRLDAVLSLNLLSAVAGAVAVALMFVVVRRWTGSNERGHSAAAVLLVAHGFWWTATLTESYAVAAALALAAIALEGRSGAIAAVAHGILVGLAAAAHLFTLTITLPVLLTGRRRLAIGLGLVVGLAPWWLGLLWSPLDPLTGGSAGGAGTWSWHLAAFVSPERALRGVAALAALLALNLGPVGGPATAWTARRRTMPGHPRPLTGAAGAILLALVLVTYSPFRLHVMVQLLVVALLLLAPPHLTVSSRFAHVLFQAGAYLALPVALQLAGHADMGVRKLPLRHNAAYFLCPIKTWESGPDIYARGLIEAAPANAVVVADFNPGAVLALSHEVGEQRPDLDLAPTAVDDALATADPAATLDRLMTAANASGRPVILADRWEAYYRARELRDRFGRRLIRCGPGWLAIQPDRQTD